MALTNAKYEPSEELKALVRRYLNGDNGQDVTNALNEASMADARFGTWFRGIRSQMNATRGRGNTWSVGTHGSRVGGSGNGFGGFSQGVSQWNQHRNARAGYAGAVTSPGGFKSSGRDEDSALRRSGTMTSDVIKAKAKVDFDKGTASFGNRKYTKAELNALLARGMSGATMNWRDQAVYDSLIGYGGNMDDVKSARMNEMRNAAVDREELARMNAERFAQADAADVLKRRRDLEDWRFKEDYQAKLKDRSTEFEALNAKHGLPSGTRLSQKDYDALESGDKVYDYDADTKKRLEQAERDIQDRFYNHEIDEEGYNAALDLLDAEKARIAKRLVTSSAPKTVEQLMSGAVNGLYVNKSGDLAAVPDTFANKLEQKRIDAEVARQNKLDDLEEKREIERRKWVAEQIVKQENAHRIAMEKAKAAFDEDEFKNKGKEFSYPAFDEIATRKRMFDLYDATEGERQMTPEMLGEARMLQAEEAGEIGAQNNAPDKEPVKPRFANDWRTSFTENDQQSDYGSCQNCGSLLDGFGKCPNCDYPEEEQTAIA